MSEDCEDVARMSSVTVAIPTSFPGSRPEMLEKQAIPHLGLLSHIIGTGAAIRLVGRGGFHSMETADHEPVT
jgi:hypothetical protein